MQNLCPCLVLVLVSVDRSISLFGTFAISFIILYSMVNLMSLLLSCRFFQPGSCIILVTLLYFEYYCLTPSFVLVQDLRYLLFDMGPILHLHILIMILLWIRRPALGVLVGNC